MPYAALATDYDGIIAHDGRVLDAVAVQTLRHGGALYVLPQEEMPDDAVAAALLR